MTTTSIYCLNDPRTGLMRYIGKADDPQKRWRAHISRAGSNDHRGTWIRSLLEQGLEPELQVLLEIPQKGWQKIEQQFIRVYRNLGFDLVNGTPGGDGCVIFGSKHSAATRAKISAAHLGKVFSVETRAKMSRSKMNPSDETRAKMRAAKIGQTLSAEARKKVSVARLGKKKSLATRKRMVEAAFRREKKKREQREKLCQ